MTKIGPFWPKEDNLNELSTGLDPDLKSADAWVALIDRLGSGESLSTICSSEGMPKWKAVMLEVMGDPSIHMLLRDAVVDSGILVGVSLPDLSIAIDDIAALSSVGLIHDEVAEHFSLSPAQLDAWMICEPELIRKAGASHGERRLLRSILGNQAIRAAEHGAA